MTNQCYSCMKTLFVLNDPPYGSERPYNALRLAMASKKHSPELTITVFLLGDAVSCAVLGQKTPNGFYNLERMMRALIAKGAKVKCCGTCLDARGLTDVPLVKGVERGSMDDLSRWFLESDKTIGF